MQNSDTPKVSLLVPCLLYTSPDNQVQEQNDSKTVTTTTTTTTTTKSSGGNMPKTGDLIVMASLALSLIHIYVGLVVVEGHAGAAAGKVLDAQPGEQRLCAVVAGADADAVHVHDARDVVRVNSQMCIRDRCSSVG